MSLHKLIELANDSGGTLYLMLLLMLIALTVVVERSRHLWRMQQGGDALIALLRGNTPLHAEAMRACLASQAQLPQARLVNAALNEPEGTAREVLAGHLEETVMHEVTALDRALWVLDTVITLAPLLGLFGTIVGMFNAFSVLGQGPGDAAQVTGGIAEALIATASGLLVAMVGLVFFNGLNNRIRLIVHQLDTLRVMLLNRRELNRRELIRRVG